MRSLQSAFPEFSGKTAVVRVNFDVPIENFEVKDTTRIEDCLETVKLLLANQCRVVLLAHAGRPEGVFSEQESLKPIIPILENYLNQSINLISYTPDYANLNFNGNLISLVDNLRFWSEEEENSESFSMALAKLGDFYVNEAFANCHRKHASIIGIPKYLPHFAGVSLEKEINILKKVINNPEKPLVVVIGGAKLETKLPLVATFAPIASNILVGGKIAVELNESPQSLPENVQIADLTENKRDITVDSANNFSEIIMQAKTVIWNGTMGVFEEIENQVGTKIVAVAVNQTQAFTLVGGGDTETALTEFNLESGIDHISTGGGAMLTFLSEKKLIGVSALEE